MKKIIAALLGATALAVLSGCSEPNITVAENATASASASAEQSTDSWTNITTFIEEMWNGSAEKALALTSPGSPAFKYATYQAASEEAYRTNGQSSLASTFSFVDDSDAGTVTITEDLPSDATTEPFESVWSDFEVDSNGLLVSWTGTSGPLRDALWTKDVNATAGKTKVELVGAYKANAGSLFIILDVKAGPNGAQLDSAPTYIENGRSVQPSYTVAPYEVQPDTSAYHVYVYDGADFGGKFKSEVMDSDYNKSGVLSFVVE